MFSTTFLLGCLFAGAASGIFHIHEWDFIPSTKCHNRLVGYNYAVEGLFAFTFIPADELPSSETFKQVSKNKEIIFQSVVNIGYSKCPKQELRLCLIVSTLYMQISLFVN